MTVPSVLGSLEGPGLEFRAREALADPASLARAVVAFLNASGGVILVGVEEENGRAVRLQTVPDIEACCRRLEEHLLDTIEPAPSGSTVRIEPDHGVVRITVREGDGKPYCRVRRSERLFVIRAGARIRPMTRDEMHHFMERSTAVPSEARARLVADRERLLDGGEAGLWMAFEPEIPMDLPLEEVGPLLTDPAASECRRGGFNVMSPGTAPTRFPDRLEQTLGEVARLEVHESGALRYRTGFELLQLGVRHGEWNPYALIELPTSMLRLASRIARRPGGSPPPAALAQLLLAGVAGACLPPFPPGTWGYDVGQAPGWMGPWRTIEEDLVATTVVRFSGDDVAGSPDRCAHRLWSQIYDAFGYPVDRHPGAYDPVSGRLRIPS
jgi:hypothetical protein